jgi:hypothetical protein
VGFKGFTHSGYFPNWGITLKSLILNCLIVLFVLGSLWGLIVAGLSDRQKGARYIYDVYIIIQRTHHSSFIMLFLTVIALFLAPFAAASASDQFKLKVQENASRKSVRLSANQRLNSRMFLDMSRTSHQYRQSPRST